jgi:hypothetical protein
MAVIGDIFDDSKSGATKGAIDKGITVTKVLGRREFRKTLVTGGHIRGNENKFLLGLRALSNFKGSISERFEMSHLKRFNPCQGRCKGRDILNELMEISILAFGIDENTFLIIQYPSPDEAFLS